jgi:S1-C subfamily serine protease
MSQTTWVNGSYTTGNGEECGRLKAVEIQKDGVLVAIEVKALKKLKRLRIFSTSETYIKTGNLNLLKLSGLLVDGNVDGKIESCGSGTNWGWDNVKAGETRTYVLFFRGFMPPGVTSFSIVDNGVNGAHGYSFRNYTITNPNRDYTNITSEYEAKKNIDSNNDGICGIYEPIDGTGANLACIKYNGDYKLIYLSSPSSYHERVLWSVGYIKANLRQTAAGIIKAEWFNAIRAPCTSAYVVFDGVSMKAKVDGDDLVYLKTYPISSSQTVGSSNVNVGGSNVSEGWTGTGFALKYGYVVTNFHVIENSKSIVVIGVNGNQNIEYKAIVVATDKNNDLALIRINDSRFTGFNNVPYAVKDRQCDVGEDVFVLGYPLTTYMGDEIKLTNGIISSRSGYQGDITTYQISAPVQPGNSGGPMFDKSGNVVGIVNAGIPGAENVGYAIKTSYLFSLINSVSSSSIIPQENKVSGASLSEKVRSVKNFVFFIKCR